VGVGNANARLPAPIAAYFAARNAFDIDRTVASFANDAVVKDENREHRGRAAIRAWVDETTQKYHAKVQPLEVRPVSDKIVVVGLVSGDFPGSPVTLDHAFVVSGDEITVLEID
jgi:ketosteroid isomerase-like protein